MLASDAILSKSNFILSEQNNNEIVNTGSRSILAY
jgi:hypothetical protein